jgi:hypothetical protein
MIAKQIAINPAKSSCVRLAEYITNDEGEKHRLGYIQITNCDADELDMVVAEVLATQKTNTRATSDKTYHLVLSFCSDEQPDQNTLKAIEDRICTSLGYGEHQRISALHNDTDNLHLHIAINKIHPKKHTIHEPYYPYKTLAEMCLLLEHEYGLQKDNHIPKQRWTATKANDMERQSGIESLTGWIRRECLNDLKNTSSWDDLHKTLAENGLEIRKQGNGFVIVASDGTTVKASSVARELSKSALEKRLGSFNEKKNQKNQHTEKPRKKYEKNIVSKKIDTTELYSRYKA